MKHTLHHVGLTVDDLAKSCAAFERMYGFSPLASWSIDDEPVARQLMGVSNASAQVTMLRGHSVMLELFEFEQQPKRHLVPEPPLTGVTHLRLRAHKEAPTTAFDTHPRLPDGISFEALETRDDDEAQKAGLKPSVRLATTMGDTLSRFYADLLLCPVSPVEGSQGAAAIGSAIEIAPVGAHHPSSPEHSLADAEFGARRAFKDPGVSHVAFATDNLEASVARARDLGAGSFTEVYKTPGASLIYGRDPDHNLIELIQLHR